MEDKIKAFLSELSALTNKHGIEIGGCGCCGSPFLSPTEHRGGYNCIDDGDGHADDLYWVPQESHNETE
jgi:hypothetical protein